ncbi:MAG: hypothetical protein LBI28_14620 [Treponema sp.]|nr:hypothetical protein [Treponema sp.]
MTKQKDIDDFLFKKLDEYKHGLKWIDLYSLIKDEYPDMKNEIIYNGINDFYTNNTSKVYKPEKGLYKLVKNNEVIFSSVDPDVFEKDDLSFNKVKEEGIKEEDFEEEDFKEEDIKEKKLKEEDFYKSFVAWLKGKEECTKAKVLGGKAFGDKWGTPDIVGVSKSLPTDIIKKEIEITSVEVKYSPYELITAFGQACSYKLFSHKVYIVIPKQSNKEEIARLDSLCLLFGIGLVLFDNTNPDLRKYELKNRAQKGTPDIDYLNKNIEKAKDFFNDLLS